MKFYVINNLRYQQDKENFLKKIRSIEEGLDALNQLPEDEKLRFQFNIHRFNSMDEAMDCFHSFPNEWRSAIGISIHEGMYEVDLVHRVMEQPVLVTDYRKMDNFKTHEPTLQTIETLKNALCLKYELNSDLFHIGSILCQINDDTAISSYFDNTLLYPMSTHNLNTAINEIHVVGKGWLSAEEFVNTYENSYTNPNRPIVTLINFEYIDKNTKRRGQMDCNIKEFIKIRDNTQQYLQEKIKNLNNMER